MDPPSSAARRASVIAGHLLGPYRSIANFSSSPVTPSPCLNYSPPDLSEKPPAFDVAALRRILDGHHHEARDWLFHLMEESPLFCPRRRGEFTFVAPDYNQTKEQQRAATMRRIEYLLGQGVFQGWFTGSDPEAGMRKFALFECIAVFDHSLSIKLGVHYFLWYYSHEWLQESPDRLPPHRDIEVSRERKKCIERNYSNSSERRSVNEEFASFSAAIDDFSDNDSMRDRGLMSPTKWWVIHGASTPTLQSLALKLLGHPSSSSCCERNWSTYNFIHSLKRNKITPQRAEDLVYVHYNLRLLSRRSPHYNEGESKMWDVGADGFDSMDMEGAAILEIANLSLDEPELESVLFTDEGGVGDETDMDI